MLAVNLGQSWVPSLSAERSVRTVPIWLRWFPLGPTGNDCGMDEAKNVPGTRLTCTNADCDCELQINTPCPHGSSYTCACGHAFEPVA